MHKIVQNNANNASKAQYVKRWRMEGQWGKNKLAPPALPDLTPGNLGPWDPGNLGTWDLSHFQLTLDGGQSLDQAQRVLVAKGSDLHGQGEARA
jgi:hypothetical protein